MGTRRSRPDDRYAARLLFQFRVVGSNGKSNRRRRYEEQIRVLRASSAEAALAKAKRIGKRAEMHYRNPRGEAVRFEFVGVLDLIQLGPECEPDEVWWAMYTLLAPAERRARLIPSNQRLLRSAGWVRRNKRQGR